MPKGSRSNRRQPAFDPSELEDLIFTPAVGTGVGSHLIDRLIARRTSLPRPPVCLLWGMHLVRTVQLSSSRLLWSCLLMPQWTGCLLWPCLQ